MLTLPAMPCLFLKTGAGGMEGQGGEGGPAMYQLCQHIQEQGRDKQGQSGTSRDNQGQAGTINERAGETVTSRTQLFQPTSAALPLLT